MPSAHDFLCVCVCAREGGWMFGGCGKYRGGGLPAGSLGPLIRGGTENRDQQGPGSTLPGTEQRPV